MPPDIRDLIPPDHICYLAEKLQPGFRTISDFRKENENLIAEVFKNTIKAAKNLGVIGLEQLSIDGSKVKAFASKNSVVMKDVLEVIGEYVKNELRKGIEIDKVEDEHFGNCRGYDQLNESEKT